MPKTIFRRIDIDFTVKRTIDGGALMYIQSPQLTLERRLTAAALKAWFKLGPDDLIPELTELIMANVDSHLWDVWYEVNMPIDEQPTTPFPRLTVNVADLDLAGLAWERTLSASIPALRNLVSIVRVSAVFPRVAAIPLTLPLRFFQVNDSPERTPLKKVIRRTLRSRQGPSIEQTVQTATCSFFDLDEFRRKIQWPTAEVLHFDEFPTLDYFSDVLSTANPEQIGTLGWLARLVDTWQTRLIFIRCVNMSQVAMARKLATALTNRGGPAVLLEEYSSREDVPDVFRSLRTELDLYEQPRNDYSLLYNGILHDMPMDVAQCILPGYTLFVGTGRSESLRVSTLGEGLVRLADELGAKRERKVDPTSLEIREFLKQQRIERPSEIDQPAINLNRIRTHLNREKEQLGDLIYASHAQESIVSLSTVVEDVRRTVGLEPSSVPFTISAGRRTRRIPPPRYVNSHFWTVTQGELSRLPQKETRLLVGHTYHLGIQVGPEDEQVRVYGAAALLEEIFKWTPEMNGVWLEIGVTGLDFEVLGNPVQELWLPREGISEIIYFAVVPQTLQVSRLRFCIYYKSDLIQSFRLAALTQTLRAKDPPIKIRSKRLSNALDLPLDSVENIGYLSKLEYSVTAKLDDVENRPVRAVSIVANDFDGRAVITTKSANVFTIHTDDDLPERVKEIRKLLENIATPPRNGKVESQWYYDFGQYDNPNVGDDIKLKNALTKLAEKGSLLFNAIYDENGQSKSQLAEVLKTEKQIIHVAHILLEKVIPWAVVYDRPYSPGRLLDDNDNPVAFDVCLAALPDENGKLPITNCAEHPKCLLHKDRLKERESRGEPSLLDETVVCPLHFWGYKHIIELPPQQVSSVEDAQKQITVRPPGEQETCILSKIPIQMTAGADAKLTLTVKHRQDLEKLIQDLAINALWTAWASHRDRILKNLRDTELDLIYFYCHAINSDEAKSIVDPYLKFQEQDQPNPGTINSADLDFPKPWNHRPLVILNGCRTAGFSPKALSPFIRKLVRGRGAAGVIGTEISVWEELATEVAVRFLKEFLVGNWAGEALLTTRRALLAKKNPLGLIYTLYGAANIRLDLDGDGKCPDK